MNYKRATMFSIIINIILILIYLICLGKKTCFSGEGNIIKSLGMINDNFTENNSKIEEKTIFALDRKPKMRKPCVRLFEENEMVFNEFSCLSDSLLHKKNISIADMDNAYEEYDSALDKIGNWYGLTMKNIQKEAKITNRELKDKIENFNNFVIKENRFERRDIKSLNQIEKKSLLLGLKTHLHISKVMSNNDIFYLTPSRGLRLYKNFPLMTTSDHGIKRGDVFNAQMMVGSFLSYPYDFYTVYLNGNKIRLDESPRKIYLDPVSIGKQQYECIVTWIHPYTKEYGIDTSYFNYTVIN